MKTTTKQVEAILRTLGVHKGYPPQRLALAGKIHDAPEAPEFTDDIARKLWREATEGRSARNPAGMLASWFDDGSWIELLADLDEVDTPAAETAERTTPGDSAEQSLAMLMRDVEEGKTVQHVVKLHGWDLHQTLRAFDREAHRVHNCSGEELRARWDAARDERREAFQQKIAKRKAPDDGPDPDEVFS